MSGTRTKKGILLAVFAWVFVISGAAVGYKYVVAPMIRGKLVAETGIDPTNATVDTKPISESDWNKLIVAKDVSIESITFGRGKSEVSIQSQRSLDEAVSILQGSPEYYLVVIGNARSDGDVEIANKLVRERVNATVDYLTRAGLVKSRIIEVPSRPSGNSGEGQTVSFVVGKMPR